MKSILGYVALLAVAIISFIAAYKLPTEEVLRAVYASPGILALLGVVYQIFRDHNAHLKNLELQQNQEIFNIGASSHMANVAFDKHVSFCEQYMEEIDITISSLYAHAVTKESIEHAFNLEKIRKSSSVWLTDEINKQLIPFEMTLRRIGAKKQYLVDTNGGANQEQRTEILLYIDSEFNKILNIEQKETPDPVVSEEAIRKKIREVLDIENLVELRKKLIKKAIKSI